jgi:hypothetical protein
MTMEGFKQFKKVQCFKEGGTVQRQIANFEKRERKTEEKSDAKQDKKIVKKAFKIHDTQQHEEKTNLAGLKKGGRAKKEVGTVKKYKTGGTVENAYGTPKTDKDIKDIANTKRQKPKKMQMGGMTMPAPAGQPANAPSAATGQMTELEKRRMMEKMARAKKYLGPAQQGELISQDPSAAGLPPVGSPLMRKKGGNVKKCAEGGKAKKMMTGGTCS